MHNEIESVHNWNSRPLAEQIRVGVKEILELQEAILFLNPEYKDHYLGESITLIERLMANKINEAVVDQIHKSFISLRDTVDAERTKAFREVVLALPDRKTPETASVERKAKRHR